VNGKPAEGNRNGVARTDMRSNDRERDREREREREREIIA
jgi:hypothetical protein